MRLLAAGIVYGPLGELPIEPDLILLWLTPRQAMFYSEAAEQIELELAPLDPAR